MKRRDITLGEMQDECKKHWNNGNFGYCGKCQYMSACCHYERYCPAQLNLTDPPRFNEAQMAFLRQAYSGGVRKLESIHSGDARMRLENGLIIGIVYAYFIKIKDGETLDLAELLWKDGDSHD